MFKAHLQTGIVFSLPCPPLKLTTYMVKSRWGAHLLGVQFMVTNSSSPSHKLAEALGSSSSSSLSGHPGPLFDRTVMVVKYPNSQGGTQSPSLCRKVISLLARYERRQIRLGRGTCSWCDHAHHGCSFSFRERCAVRSVYGVPLACRLNLAVLGNLHQAWSPHVNWLRAVATSPYDILFLGGEHVLVRSVGFICSPIDVTHPIVCTS